MTEVNARHLAIIGGPADSDGRGSRLRSGLNLRQSEGFDAFVAYYGDRRNAIRAWLQSFR